MNGLAPDIWQGSEISRLMVLIPKLPAPVGVPSLRDLQRRLLETPSAGGAAVDPLQPMRADKLHQMGFSDEAVGIAAPPAGVLAAPMDPQEAVERSLLANDNAGACRQVEAYMARSEAPPLFFRRAVVFCQILRKENDAASLGIDLLRERNDADQATRDFIALAALANGETRRVPENVAAPDPLNVAMMKTVGMPAPSATGASVAAPVGAAGPAMIARDAARPLPERVAAAEEAFSHGLVTDRELGDLYLQMPAGIADPAAAIGISDSLDLRAQLFQAAYRASDPVARARVIGVALAHARQRGDYLNEAQLFGPLLAGLQPAPGLAFFAPEAARLMFLTGNPERGGFWLNSVAANAGIFTRPGEREGLDLLGRIAGLQGAAADPVSAWSVASGTVNPRVELFYALLSGLKVPVASGVVGSFQANPVITVGSPSAEIIAAASGGRKGETLVLTLAGIGGDRAIASDPATLSAGLRSMADLGFAVDARRIAVEIAVLAGL